MSGIHHLIDKGYDPEELRSNAIDIKSPFVVPVNREEVTVVNRARVLGSLMLMLSGFAQAQPIKNALGNWKIFHGGGEPIFVQVLPGGIAHFRGDKGAQGSWKLINGRLELSWQDGWQDVILRRGKSYRKLGYAPGHSIQGRPDHETAAYRRP